MIAFDDDVHVWEDDDGTEHVECSICGGDGVTECNDPIQCTHPGCDGEFCYCSACSGRGYDQTVW